MKLIFLSSLVPVANPKSGYDIANRVICDGLIALGMDVHVVGFLTPGETPAYAAKTHVLKTLQVTNAKVSKVQKAYWLASAFLRKEAMAISKMHAASERKVKNILDDLAPFDGVILNSIQFAGAFHNIVKQYPSIFVAHNVESQTAQTNADNARHPITSYLFAREAKLHRKMENMLCKRADHIWTLADYDKTELGYSAKTTTLPLVTTFQRPDNHQKRDCAYDIGLIGSWGWAANRIGLDWFLKSIVPKLPNTVSIAIAGNIDQIPDNIPENVKFVGRVECAEKFTRSCRIIPLVAQKGTGIQLKTLETFQMGLPSVATQSSVRGITDIPENCLLRDEPQDFAEALIELLQKTGTDNRLDQNGSEFHDRQKQKLTDALKFGLEAASWCELGYNNENR